MDSPEALQKKIRDLEAKLEASGIELEANEAILKLAMEDMRRIYDDLLRSRTQLMQSDKLATIGLLTAGIVHEINNPLAALRLVFSLLDSQMQEMETFSATLSGEARAAFDAKKKEWIEYVGQGKKCVDTIVRIAGDIRMFSRSDKGVMNEESLNQIIESVIGIVWNSLKNKVAIEKQFTEVPKIRCNAQQLSQVFLNLIVNASQAIGEKKGLITIRTGSDETSVFASVSDTGCGMAPEVKDKIFEAFFTTKGAEEGTGLGLSITHDIIKKHDGRIQVDSEIGKGTTFTVLFPR